MRLSLGYMNKVVASFLLAGAVAGCGSASSNDQGTSFSLLGFFSEAGSGESAELPAFDEISFPISEIDSEGVGRVGAETSVLGVENFLGCQGMRVDRVYLDYFVPGATSQPPSTIQAVSMIMGPSAGETSSCSSSLPAGFANISSRAYGTVAVVPAAVREWIVLNRASLPEAPFNLIISAYVAGVTTAGDRYESNSVEISAEVTPDLIITPTQGSDEEVVSEEVL